MIKKKPTEHHIWCNYFMLKEPDKCPMCKRLNREYPMDGMTEDALVLKYFPNVIKRS